MRFLHTTMGYKNKAILCDVSLQIDRGEWVFLVGPSGMGKTTLLQTISGTLCPLSGSLIDHRGRDVYGLKPGELRAYRRTLGMVFQDTQLIDYKTVAENIAYAMEICRYSIKSIQIRTDELLREVGMWEKRDSLPSELSGGEAQKVAIARALIHEPAVILADEPTGHLDRENLETIIEIFQKIHRQGTTIIFSTHDHDLLTLVPEARVVDVEQL